jgi:hypothetical protein
MRTGIAFGVVAFHSTRGGFVHPLDVKDECDVLLGVLAPRVYVS